MKQYLDLMRHVREHGVRKVYLDRLSLHAPRAGTNRLTPNHF